MRLLRISSPHCGPCRRLAAVLPQEAAARGLPVETLDATADPRRAAALGVRSVPTLIAMQGEVELARMVGFAGLEGLTAFLDGLPPDTAPQSEAKRSTGLPSGSRTVA